MLKVAQNDIKGRWSGLKKRGKYMVITAALVPEARGVNDRELEKEIREEVEKITIPWVKRILKVKISDYLRMD